jgi:hypothetical protein
MERKIKNKQDLRREILRQKALVSHREEILKNEFNSLLNNFSAVGSAGKFAFSSFKAGFGLKRFLLNYFIKNFGSKNNFAAPRQLFKAFKNYFAKNTQEAFNRSKLQNIFKTFLGYFKRR